MIKTSKRLFVAIDFSDSIVYELRILQDQLKHQTFFDAKYPDPTFMHLTLVFVGDISSDKIPLIKNALRDIKMVTFQSCFTTLGYFSNEEHIKIVWLGLQSDKLNELALLIGQNLQKFVLLENRPFHAHITLARIRKIIDHDSTLSFIRSIPVPKKCFDINEFVLKESLFDNTVQYLDIERYPF